MRWMAPGFSNLALTLSWAWNCRALLCAGLSPKRGGTGVAGAVRGPRNSRVDGVGHDTDSGVRARHFCYLLWGVRRVVAADIDESLNGFGCAELGQPFSVPRFELVTTRAQ